MESFETGTVRLLAPLGVPTLFIADDPSLLASACAAYSSWRADALSAPERIEIRLRRNNTLAAQVGCAIEVKGSRLELRADGAQGWADANLRRAACAISPDLADDPFSLAEEAIDPLLLFLLARSGRTPVHAAGIVIGGRALLLSGQSGSGKSTLALAAARRGLPVLSDDTVFVQTEPGLRVWGLGGAIHVFSRDAPPGHFARRTRNGKVKLAVPPGEPVNLVRHADRMALVLLARGHGLSLEPASVDEARERLSCLEPGFNLLARQSAVVAEALTGTCEIWRLSLSRDPDEALALLRERFGSG